MSGYCRWWDRKLEDVTEHEQERCEENGQECWISSWQCR